MCLAVNVICSIAKNKKELARFLYEWIQLKLQSFKPQNKKECYSYIYNLLHFMHKSLVFAL